MPMTAGNVASLLEPGLREIFDIAVSRPNPIMDTLFGVVTSTQRTEHYQGMGAVGLVPAFDGTVPYTDFAGGYKTNILNYEFAQGIVVERALLDDDQYNAIQSRAQSLGDSFAITREVDAADVFINAFTDGGTNRFGQSTNGADAVGLGSTAHPHSPSNTGSTQSNEGTLALDLPNLDTTKQLMMNYTDDQDNLLGIVPDTLLVPPELQRTATQIVSARANLEPGSAEFNVNMFAGALNLVVWNRLTDANAWFLIDSRLMRQRLHWQNRIAPEFSAEGDFDGIQQKFRGYMRYGIGWSDWRWVHGQNPA